MEKSDQAQEFWINAGAGRIFAKAWNYKSDPTADSEPILLIHDSLGCVELWRDFPPNLARSTGRAVIAYDRLGFGKSDKHPARLGLSFVQDEAHSSFSAVLGRLGIEKFIVFGHSVGGGMAIAAAAAFPEHCRALITESAQAFVEDRTLEGIRVAQRGFEQHEAQMARLRRYHGDKAEWALSSWTGTWLSADFSPWRLDEELQAVRCPVLAIHGGKDEYGSVEHAKRIARLANGPATVEILPDCGHIPHRENQPAVLDAVARFLRRQ